jgi:hypothetical protein
MTYDHFHKIMDIYKYQRDLDVRDLEFKKLDAYLELLGCDHVHPAHNFIGVQTVDGDGYCRICFRKTR